MVKILRTAYLQIKYGIYLFLPIFTKSILNVLTLTTDKQISILESLQV